MDLPTRKDDLNEKLEDGAMIIPYKPLSQKQTQISIGILLFTALLIILYCFNAPFLTTIPASALIFLSIVGVLAVSLSVASLALMAAPKGFSKITLSEEKLEFPTPFAPDMLFRQRRNWDDIANILLGSMILEDRKGTYEHELETANHRKRVFIYFKSGGHAAIDLNRLSKADTEKLFLAIESWCLDFSRSPKLQKKEDDFQTAKRKKLEREEQELPQSYTELWEQEMQDHFSATNFVPLKKGDFIQEAKYRVLMPLSSGGLSAVYLVESKDKELRVLKEAVIPENLKLQEKAREMFAREASLLQKINHTNIAGVYDYFVDNNRDYLLLDFIPGNTLRQQLAQYGPITEETALEYALDMVALLSYLHDMNPPIIHRDISPDNLVLREDGSLVLIDFGAANELIGTATGTLVGKQSYMAPEQFRGKAVKASDIYGIGTTLYFLLTGKDPKPLSVCNPREANKNVSPGTDNIVASCTAQLKEERINSLQDLHNMLSEVLEKGGGEVLDIS